MTQKEKQLLLIDLCARLIYGVKIQTWYGEIITSDINTFPMSINEIDIEQLSGMKPYLRPMSSLTEEEKQEMHRLLSPTGTATYQNTGIATPVSHFGDFIPYEYMARVLKWLNAHHFDYHGLIEMGLALEAQEGMYNNKTKKI